jgi:hypothetical protein
VKPVTVIPTNIVIDVPKDSLLNQELLPPVINGAQVLTTKKKRPDNVRNVKNHVRLVPELKMEIVPLVLMDTVT